jgi:RNA polymerase-interacting CarD/CdnL/TRCF family regulator
MDPTLTTKNCERHTMTQNLITEKRAQIVAEAIVDGIRLLKNLWERPTERDDETVKRFILDTAEKFNDTP